MCIRDRDHTDRIKWTIAVEFNRESWNHEICVRLVDTVNLVMVPFDAEKTAAAIYNQNHSQTHEVPRDWMDDIPLGGQGSKVGMLLPWPSPDAAGHTIDKIVMCWCKGRNFHFNVRFETTEDSRWQLKSVVDTRIEH